jgi:hypothetical protein
MDSECAGAIQGLSGVKLSFITQRDRLLDVHETCEKHSWSGVKRRRK